MNNEAPATSPGGEVVVYETPDGEVRVDVRLEQETVWLSQRDMAEVFDTSPENVLMHLRNVFSSKELEAEATTKDFLVVRTEGRRQVKRRILDAIISVGYRVNSKRGVRFRQWATRTLREHLVRGFTLNERRLAERGLREARETLDNLDDRAVRAIAASGMMARNEASSLFGNPRGEALHLRRSIPSQPNGACAFGQWAARTAERRHRIRRRRRRARLAGTLRLEGCPRTPHRRLYSGRGAHGFPRDRLGATSPRHPHPPAAHEEAR